MRAAIQQEHSAPVAIGEAQTPSPGPSEVLVRVLACGLNHLDLWLRQGDTGDALSLPRIPGTDVLGVVDAVGADVDAALIGNRVLIYPGRSCGQCEHCLAGNESACHRFEILGYHVDGGYAEYAVTSADSLVSVPGEGLAWAAVPVAYITAWNALVTKGRLRAGQTVAVWGAAGGLGNAALRLAAALDARPIAIVGDPGKADWLRSTGFEGPVVVRGDSVVREVRGHTGKRGVDIVLDHVGAQTFAQSLGMLAAGGHLAFCGVTSGHVAQVDLRRIFGRQLTIVGTWIGNLEDLTAVVDLLRQRPEALPNVTARFGLDEAAAAQDEVSDPGRVGKVILAVDTQSEEQE
ncbi:MAG: alcohol dehydrogenase catalytic domain-containing protein [Propionibacteriaceae bacterium]